MFTALEYFFSPHFWYIKSVPCRIKEKYAFKLNTKLGTQVREGKRQLLLLFFLDTSVAHHYYDYRGHT